MATVTKCDRCGQYIDKLPESLPFISYKKSSDCTSKRYTMSLCPECYKYFLEWVKPFEQRAVMVDCETDDGE